MVTTTRLLQAICIAGGVRQFSNVGGRTGRNFNDLRKINNPIYSPPPQSALLPSWRPPEPDPRHKSLSICVVGAPNAGKSTLLNAFVGNAAAAPVSAVSRKYNTTRGRILGVATEGFSQLCIVDTPGFLVEGDAQKGRFNRTLVSAAIEAVPESDFALLVLDIAKRFDDEAKSALSAMIRFAVKSNVNLILVANKCDLLRGTYLDHRQKSLSQIVSSQNPQYGQELSGITRRMNIGGWPAVVRDCLQEHNGKGFAFSLPPGTSAGSGASHDLRSSYNSSNIREGGKTRNAHVDLLHLKLDIVSTWLERELVTINGNINCSLPPLFAISSRLGHGVNELKTSLLSVAPLRSWLYPRDTVTDSSLVARVAEAIREELLGRLHDEVPYALQQETRSWRVVDEKQPPHPIVTEIHQDIRVPSQRVAAMLLANEGSAIKSIAEASREKVALILGTRVRLHLHVTVKSEAKLRREAGSGME
jgi:small GTP-binding protein